MNECCLLKIPDFTTNSRRIIACISLHPHALAACRGESLDADRALDRSGIGAQQKWKGSMQFIPARTTPAMLLTLLMACSALTSPAYAKPRKAAQPPVAATSHDERYPAQASAEASPQRTQPAPALVNVVAFGGFGGGDVVSEARRWIGGNPTGRSSLWCGAFMDFVLKRTGHAGGGNLARDYANYGTRIASPRGTPAAPATGQLRARRNGWPADGRA